jgi:hypothetical protein
MFWFKGKEQENYTKEKQIRELSITFPSIRRPNQDDNLFEIVFEIDRKINTLKIYLPSDFPANKPGRVWLYPHYIFFLFLKHLSQFFKWLDQLFIPGWINIKELLDVIRFRLSIIHLLTLW